MAQIQWKDRYNIRYKEIDEQHKSLLLLLNEVIDLVDLKTDPVRVTSLFRELGQYALTHFATEERYLERCGYELLAKHREEHGSFVQQLLDWDQAYDPQDSELTGEMLAFLKRWYLDHIIHSDQDYAACLKTFRQRAEIKGIVFDFGNVISRFDNYRFAARMAELSGRPAEEIHQQVYLGSELPAAYESGRVCTKEFMDGMARIVGPSFREEAFIQAFTGIFDPIESTWDLIRSLVSDYKLGLISNTNELHFEHVIKKTKIFPLFDAVTLSYQVGAMKPDPSLYADSIAKLDLMAEECVFIDDIATYVEGAERAWMHGIHYRDHGSLVAALRGLKVRI